jgi:hypothetical protein
VQICRAVDLTLYINSTKPAIETWQLLSGNVVSVTKQESMRAREQESKRGEAPQSFGVTHAALSF